MEGFAFSRVLRPGSVALAGDRSLSGMAVLNIIVPIVPSGRFVSVPVRSSNGMAVPKLVECALCHRAPTTDLHSRGCCRCSLSGMAVLEMIVTTFPTGRLLLCSLSGISVLEVIVTVLLHGCHVCPVEIIHP